MLVDTRVLVRTLQPHHPLYTLADGAIRLLPARGEKLHIVAQLWVVATRPLGEHGLGMNPAEAIYPAWEAQVLEHAVSERSVGTQRFQRKEVSAGVPTRHARVRAPHGASSTWR